MRLWPTTAAAAATQPQHTQKTHTDKFVGNVYGTGNLSNNNEKLNANISSWQSTKSKYIIAANCALCARARAREWHLCETAQLPVITGKALDARYTTCARARPHTHSHNYAP